VTGLERQGNAVSNCGLVRRTTGRLSYCCTVQAFVMSTRPASPATVAADHCEISLLRISADNCTSTTTTTTKATTTTTTTRGVVL